MIKAYFVHWDENFKDAKIEVFDTKIEAGKASFDSNYKGKLVVAEIGDLSPLNGQELVSLYNSLNGGEAVKKFRDLDTGRSRTLAIIKGLAESAMRGDTVGGTATIKKYNKLKEDKKLHILVEKNPRRENTAGHKSFSIMKDGMTVKEYIAKGGRRVDLKWDLEHKSVELVD